MTTDQIAAKRRWFFIGISLLATAITLASFGATLTINERSFADWPEFGGVFAWLASAGIECTFALTLYGVSYALVGSAEKGIGAALLVGTIFMMATNYTVHHKLTTGVRLSEWQITYIQWAGPASLFVILLLIAGLVIFNDDARKRRLEREVTYAAQRKAMQWEQSQLRSEAFEEHMEQYRPQVFEKVRRQLTLPSLPQAPKPATGFRPPSERAEDDSKNE